jgi:oxygen-independent coproporphyrinogen-3 oxidase
LAAPDVSHYLRPGTLRLPALPPLSLYVHFPWCVHKCPYCDFNSHEHPGGIRSIPEAQYLDALCADLEQSLPLIWGRRVQSIFLGGGTPSLLSAAGLDRLLADVRARLPLTADCEITLEANPGTVEAQRFADYRASGVNRLSLGIQSFDDAALRALGRIHDSAQARAAVAVAARSFDNFNLDLMYALPGQDLTLCQRDLAAAIAFQPPHLSLYQLTLEPNTVFAKYPPSGLPDDDAAAAMQEHIEEVTAAAGFEHYEVSAYAQAGRRSRHNLNYWRFGDYLGIGAGAHSKLSFPHRVVRQVRLRQPESYLGAAERRAFVAESFEVSRGDLPFEYMLNVLRLGEGFAPADFVARTGLSLGSIEAPLAEAEARGLVIRSHERIAPTALGRLFLSDLQALFLPARRDASN